MKRPVWLGLLITLLLCLPHNSDAQAGYLRLSVGYEASNNSRWQDHNWNATQPYFGAGIGTDGRPLGAHGDFGSSAAFEVALGKTIYSLFRVETVLTQRNGLEFTGVANLPAKGALQPVEADIQQQSLMAFGYVDLSLLLGLTPGEIEPYLGVGAGVARNRTSAVLYHFPDLAPSEQHLLPSSVGYQFAFAATAGLGWSISNNLMLDVAWRYSDYGVVETESGALEIHRTGLPLATQWVDSTQATLRTHAIYTGLRLNF